jgi:hypothetical protein
MGTVTREHARRTLLRDVNPIKGICEVLRLIYDEIHPLENKEKITELLVDAMMMSKKMHNRLVYYKTTYKDTTGHNLKNLERLTHNRERAKMRKTR